MNTAVNIQSFRQRSDYILSFILSSLLALLALHGIPPPAHADVSVSFTWLANPEAVDGYRLYYRTGSSGPPYNGTGAAEGPSPIETGDVTSFSLHGLSETETYYFVLTAYSDTAESGFTEEVVLLPAPDSNTLPTASNASFTTRENEPIGGYLTASDPDNDALSYIIIENGSLGNAVITSQATGAFTYTPIQNTSGDDAFTFLANDGTGDSNIATVQVHIEAVNSPPAAVISVSVSQGTAPLQVHFDGTGSADDDGSITFYAWNFGDGTSAAGTGVYHTYDRPGSYIARLTVTDNEGMADSATRMILVTEPDNEPPQAVITAAPLEGVNPLTVAFEADGSFDGDGWITSYTWDFGDGETGTGETADHVFTRAGIFTVTLEVTDNEGAKNRSTSIIRVLAAENEKTFPWVLFLPIITGKAGLTDLPKSN